MIDHSLKRLENASRILLCLQSQGPMRRQQMSKLLSIRPNSVGSVCEELLEKGLVEFIDETKPRSALKIKGSGAWALTFNTGHRGLLMSSVDLEGRVGVVKRLDIDPASASASNTVEVIQQAVEGFISEMGSRPLGIGGALTGVVREGCVVRSIHFGQWFDVPLQEMLREALRMPVYIENDTRCVASSQLWFNSDLRGKQSVYFLSLGEGISSAMLMRGVVHRGGQGSAGEIGHIKVGSEKRRCYCGKLDCLETYCGSQAIISELALGGVKLSSEQEPMEQLAELCESSVVVKNILDRVGETLAQAIVPIVAALDPDMLVVVSHSELFSQQMVKVLTAHLDIHLLGHDSRGMQSIGVGQIPELRMQGAASLVFKEFFESGASEESFGQLAL